MLDVAIRVTVLVVPKVFTFVEITFVVEIALDATVLPFTVRLEPTPVEVLMPMTGGRDGTFSVERFEPPEKMFPTGAEIEPILACWSIFDPKFELKYVKVPWTVRF
jgi:hypothetical protein